MTKKEMDLVIEFKNTFNEKRIEVASCSCLFRLKDILVDLLEKVNDELKKFEG